MAKQKKPKRPSAARQLSGGLIAAATALLTLGVAVLLALFRPSVIRWTAPAVASRIDMAESGWSVNHSADEGTCNIGQVGFGSSDFANAASNLLSFGEPVRVKIDWGLEELNGTAPLRAAFEAAYGHVAIDSFGQTNSIQFLSSAGMWVDDNFKQRETVGGFLQRSAAEPNGAAYIFSDVQGSDIERDAPRLSRLGTEMLRNAPEQLGVRSSTFRVALGAADSGIPFHEHPPALNLVLHGRKRWFIFRGNDPVMPKGVVMKAKPGSCASGKCEPYPMRRWLDDVYPRAEVQAKWQIRGWECTTGPGEMLYVPSNAYHGVINLDETVALVTQLEYSGRAGPSPSGPVQHHNPNPESSMLGASRGEHHRTPAQFATD